MSERPRILNPEQRPEEDMSAYAAEQTKGMLAKFGGLLKTRKGMIFADFILGGLALGAVGATTVEARHGRHFGSYSAGGAIDINLDRDPGGAITIDPDSPYGGRFERLSRRDQAYLMEQARVDAIGDFERGIQREPLPSGRYRASALAIRLYADYYTGTLHQLRSQQERRVPPVIVQPVPGPVAPYEQRIVPESEMQRQLSEGERNLLTERAVQQAQADFRMGTFQEVPVPPKGYEKNSEAHWVVRLAYKDTYAKLGSQQLKGAAPPPPQERAVPSPRPSASIRPEARRETQAELRTALKAMAEFAAAKTAKGNRPYNEDPQAHLAPPDMTRFSSIPHWKDAFERYYRDHVKARQKIMGGKQSSLQGDEQDQGPTFTIK